jgi:hypothetical protein
MDDYELDLVGHQVDLIANPQRTQVAILFRQVTFQGMTPAVSSKLSRLGLTTDQAMRLLALLDAFRQSANLPAPELVSQEFVPPKREQN